MWWTTQWLGWLLAGGVGLTGLALYIESTRHKPMLDWHWMTVPQILIFAVMGVMARLLTSEQTVGAAGLMGAVGVGSAQMSTFYLIVAGGMLAGVVGSLILLDINDIRRPVMVALACFALGAWLEIGVGMQTRPAQLYFSQFIVAFASLLFMGPMMLEGALRALAKSPDHMMSFSAVFGLSQTLGGLAGAAAFSAFLTYRTRDHLAAIAQNLTLSNPALAADIQRNAAALSATLSDPVLLQGRAVSQITAQAGKEASVAAYSDLFALLAAMAAVSTLVAVALWLYRRYYKIDILAAEKTPNPKKPPCRSPRCSLKRRLKPRPSRKSPPNGSLKNTVSAASAYSPPAQSAWCLPCMPSACRPSAWARFTPTTPMCAAA